MEPIIHRFEFCGRPTWALTSAPTTNYWSSIASSADGTKLVAADFNNGGGIYISTNSGGTWAKTSAPLTNWNSVASSVDGIKLSAAAGIYPHHTFYISTNSGATWFPKSNAPSLSLYVACSADGIKLIVSENGDGEFATSTNFGMTWMYSGYQNFGRRGLTSADGNRMATSDFFYVSTNSGITWQANFNLPFIFVGASAISADGNRFVRIGVGSSSGIYTSTNFGIDWTTNNVPNTNFSKMAMSADGTKIVATVKNGGIYTSPDSGITWTSNSVPTNNWSSVASSADGTKLMAAVLGGGIYTMQTTPSPHLNLLPLNSNLAFSWIVPSTNFVLQENLDLNTANWVTLTNAPALNLTNLQDEISLSPSNSSGFFRLLAQ